MRTDQPQLDDAEEGSHGQHGHALLLGHRPPEILRQAERTAEDANVRRNGGRQCAEPAEVRFTHDVADRHDEQRIGDAIGNLVVQRAGR